ncbi:MAG TPA: (d)CMP kinase [Bacteroidia bacterium]|jgi:cytidylate kinase|nr:(d)CMP kinase [Bacteroidia bacterium]HMU19975.1 (d)CMP kinase [Bacteroidia bacterium]
MIIAIDGYSSCGKSTVAKTIAKRLKLNYIDSGAMYRAVTLYFLQNNIPFSITDDVATDYSAILENIHIEFIRNEKSGLSEIYLNGKNIETEIRQMDVSDNVSYVSAIKSVRKKLVFMQQQMAAMGHLVMDGRDIGTTVFPNADLKIFMTASPEVRVYRRYHELIEKGIKVTPDEIRKNIELRDYEDTHREESPLRKPDDAIILDNTYLSRGEQVQFVLDAVANLKKTT